jgi:hypothetical protein
VAAHGRRGNKFEWFAKRRRLCDYQHYNPTASAVRVRIRVAQLSEWPRRRGWRDKIGGIHRNVHGHCESTGVPHGAAILFRTSQNGLSFGVLAWALYMSVEPYVRRHWPQALIGWTRALGGNFRDPIVAGHILVGIAVGIATDLLIGNFHGVRSGQFTPVPGATGIVANWLGDLAIPPLIALAIAFLFVLLRLVLRRGWIAAAIIGVLVAVRLANGSLVELPLSIVGTALLLGVSIRFGILALSITIIVNPLDRYPLTPNLSAWFAPQGWLEVAFVLAVSLWAFRNALGGWKVWKGDLLDG